MRISARGCARSLKKMSDVESFKRIKFIFFKKMFEMMSSATCRMAGIFSRSLQELRDELLVASQGVDTAENGRFKVSSPDPLSRPAIVIVLIVILKRSARVGPAMLAGCAVWSQVAAFCCTYHYYVRRILQERSSSVRTLDFSLFFRLLRSHGAGLQSGGAMFSAKAAGCAARPATAYRAACKKTGARRGLASFRLSFFSPPRDAMRLP